MIFNDTTSTKQGIVQDVYFNVGANANSYPIEALTRDANKALDIATSKIIGADGRWRFSDSNNTDLDIGETDLVSGQEDYSYDSRFLTIEKMEVKDPNGNWIGLIPIDNQDINQKETLENLFETSGIPQFYDKMGDSFLLKPVSNYNWRQTTEGEQGIRVYFQRKMDYFLTTDTIKEPGFAKHLHNFVSLYCQYCYAKAKDLVKKISGLKTDIEHFIGNKERGGNDAGAIADFYAYREIDQKRRITNNLVVKK